MRCKVEGLGTPKIKSHNVIDQWQFYIVFPVSVHVCHKVDKTNLKIVGNETNVQ